MLGVGILGVGIGPENGAVTADTPCIAKAVASALQTAIVRRAFRNDNADAQQGRVEYCVSEWLVEHQVRPSSIGSSSVATIKRDNPVSADAAPEPKVWFAANFASMPRRLALLLQDICAPSSGAVDAWGNSLGNRTFISTDGSYCSQTTAANRPSFGKQAQLEPVGVNPCGGRYAVLDQKR